MRFSFSTVILRGKFGAVVARRLTWHLLLFLLAFASPASAADPAANPVADPRAVVISEKARFTVLTPQLIRMEWAADGRFEDHASLVFINRRLPVPPFRTHREGKWLVIATEKLLLRYQQKSGKFRPDNLQIDFDLNGPPEGRRVTWTPAMEDEANLGGTTRTLDGVRGPTSLEPGLISRDGWVLVDDSDRPLFDDSDWPWVMSRPIVLRQDWYFFGYGHEYRKALYDFTQVAGKIPLPPRFAFGAWWSRYWAYSDQEFEELVRGFHEHDVPLDVLVIDMDWHQTFGVKWWQNLKDQSGHKLGWTGYTWNRLLFPDPPKFLDWVHRQGLKATLNMHPASGVQPHEEQYPEMARAMGIDPATKNYVPFDLTNKKFAENYMNILHHPFERLGIDFFWLDWQQEPNTRVQSVNNTWWLNYVHFTDMEREGKRPLLFHRWGGLGNHRYQIGFSGDAIIAWESLAFQPYFTATAANVGYGYWSHDIGGHIPGPAPPEMYTRWVQWGAFSPILRTHTTKNPDAERRIWAFPAEYAETMRQAFLLRYALIPYLYTAGREAYDTGISICHPLYYDDPETLEAYDFKDEYLFGGEMLVAPVTAPLDEESQLAKKTVWLPEGKWIEWFSGQQLQGPAKVERAFALNEIPVYVKAGAIIPMQPKMRSTSEKPVDPLILVVFPGDSGETRVYDDEGNTPGYQRGQNTWTRVRHSTLADGKMSIEIFPVEGSYPRMVTERGYEIRLPISWPPESVAYRGQRIHFSSERAVPGWHYEGNTLTTTITLPKSSVNEKIEVVIQFPDAQSHPWRLLDGVPGKLARLRKAYDALNNTWPHGWSSDAVIEAAQTGRRIELQPATTREELEKLERNLPTVIGEIYKMDADCKMLVRALAQLGEAARCAPSKIPEPAHP